jgi:hypothetical protein
MYFQSCTYVFDLLEFNPFRGKLRNVSIIQIKLLGA